MAVRYPLSFKLVLRVLRDSGFTQSQYTHQCEASDHWVARLGYHKFKGSADGDYQYCKDSKSWLIEINAPELFINDREIVLDVNQSKFIGEQSEFRGEFKTQHFYLADPECFEKLILACWETEWSKWWKQEARCKGYRDTPKKRSVFAYKLVEECTTNWCGDGGDGGDGDGDARNRIHKKAIPVLPLASDGRMAPNTAPKKKAPRKAKKVPPVGLLLT